MKKAIALAIIGIFVFSLIPLAFAQETAEIKARAEARKQANIQRLTVLKEPQRAKIESLSTEKLNRMANLSNERLQKIAELDKRQIERLATLNIKNLEKIAELKKERLERITNLSEEKLERLSELEKDKLEKISDLNDTELEKASAFGRARLKTLAGKDQAKIKAELKAVKVVKVKNADDLDKRKISEARLTQLREKFEKAKEDFNNAKDELSATRQKLKEARDKKDEKATLEQAKNYVLRTTDALISHLEKIKAKVQESGNIAEDSATKIVAEIDTQIAEINKIKTEAQAATTKEQIKEVAKKLNNKWSSLKNLIELHTERVVSARVEGIINQGLVLEKRLDAILAKTKEKGIEVDVSAEVNQFSEKIATAKDKYTQAQAKLTSVLDLKAGDATTDQVKAAADEAKILLKEARDTIKDAHGILKTIVKKIREADPKADISAEVEIEIAEEPTVSAVAAEATATTETSTTASAST